MNSVTHGDFNSVFARMVHGILTKLLIALIGLHVVGALYHQFIVKDRLFARIWFGKKAPVQRGND
ncbi:MAG: cytochrome b [Rhizobiaceae bacterium]